MGKSDLARLENFIHVKGLKITAKRQLALHNTCGVRKKVKVYLRTDGKEKAHPNTKTMCRQTDFFQL